MCKSRLMIGRKLPNRVLATLFALCFGWTFAFSTNPAEARTLLPIVGTAPGDHTVTATCPNGQELVGLAGRAGLWIDQIRLVCATPLAGGEFSAPTPTGDFLGGEGGAPQMQTCDRMSRLHGVRISLGYAGNKKVAAIVLICIAQDGRETRLAFYSSKDLGDMSYWDRTMTLQTCPEQVFTGFTARFGNDLNSIGFVCDATPMPVRLTGRPR